MAQRAVRELLHERMTSAPRRILPRRGERERRDERAAVLDAANGERGLPLGDVHRQSGRGRVERIARREPSTRDERGGIHPPPAGGLQFRDAERAFAARDDDA